MISLVLSIGGSLATYSYKVGALETTAASNIRRIEVLEQDKAKRDAAAAARLEAYEQARAAEARASAAKMAEFDELIKRLQTVPPPR